MSDQHLFMIFGALIAAAGVWLATTAKTGHGQATIRIFGGEFTLATAGGILVIALGVATFALPSLAREYYDRGKNLEDKAAPHQAPAEGSRADPLCSAPAIASALSSLYYAETLYLRKPTDNLPSTADPNVALYAANAQFATLGLDISTIHTPGQPPFYDQIRSMDTQGNEHQAAMQTGDLAQQILYVISTRCPAH